MEYDIVRNLAECVAAVKPSMATRSFWSGDTIQAGVTCLVITQEQRELWCSVGDADAMVTALEQVATGDSPIGPIGSVEVIDADRQVKHDCFMCSEAIGDAHSILLFQPPADDIPPAQLALHYDCRTRFSTNVERIWNHSADILPTHL